MFWLILIILLIAVFGLGSILEAAFWTLAILALVVLITGFAMKSVLT